MKSYIVLITLLPGCFSEPPSIENTEGEESSSSSGDVLENSSSSSGAENEVGSTADSHAGSGDNTSGEESTTGSACDLLFEIDGDCTDEPEGMAVIEGATFTMGCDQEIEMASCGPDEFPVHDVDLTTYVIDFTEVTVAAYEACESCSPRNTTAPECNRSGEHDDHPANCVTWEQAATYCEAVGKRLPTEAEWEYAAEGSLNNRWPWGDEPNPNCDLAVIVTDGPGCGTGRTFPVASKPDGSNGENIFDLVGNVQEWTGDWYGPYGAGEDEDVRSVRGSAWVHGTMSSNRVRKRWSADPAASSTLIGFRCAASARTLGP